FLMPGVVDRHVHVAFADPAALLAGGVTAVRDLGWPPDDVLPLADASESPSFNGPLIRAVGPIITCRGGYPTRSSWAAPGTGLEVHGTAQAAEAVRRTLQASGIPVVKIAVNADAGPTLTDEELVAICDAAHHENAIVTAHVQGKGQVERAVGAGIDEFAHTPWTEHIPDHLIEVIAGRVRMVSTLDILSYGTDTPELRVALDNLSRFIQAGGTVTYGTDLGNGPIPAAIHVGEAWHLFRAGLSPERVLEALTFRPLAPGEPGDLIGLGGDPVADLNALSDLRLVMRAGRVARRS
ncbi:MAG TPA: amidohydrolase family protein, partial [Actinomycetota bacterium]|nr:amidohydrolase family protein [Actinomycetota bacterium]